jgi:hypothetical protein
LAQSVGRIGDARRRSVHVSVGLYSYVVARDYGFAPNPFHGVCTLATCKPDIRERASRGDWVLGTGGADYGLVGHLVWAMEVSDTMPFDQYWADRRFLAKRPNLNSSLMQAFGDNIYHRERGRWRQENSHHSHPDGRPNPANIANDTKADRVLIGERYLYLGDAATKIPVSLRKKLCAVRGYKSRFDPEFIAKVLDWIDSLQLEGVVGSPAEWRKRRRHRVVRR